MLKLKVIRESSSPYAFPVVIVRKRDRSNKTCVDYRGLNKIAMVGPEPITHMMDLMQKLS